MANNHKSIKQELEEVQSLILENQYLQEKYPERKLELELGLQSLRELETEMFEALKKEQVHKKLEVVEMRLDGSSITNGSMPMKDYGQFLIDSQEVITYFAEDRPLSLNQSPSINIHNNTQMDVFAQCTGSLRVLLISKQSRLDNEENESPVNIALKKLNRISSSDEEFSEIIKKEKIGKKQISSYKKLMNELSSHHLNLEVKKPVKDKPDELLWDIKKEKAFKMFKLIDEKPKPKEKTKSVTGIVKALDLEKHKFKIESTYGDETKIIRCDFDKKYEEYMVENFNKEITVKLKNITEEFVDRNLNKVYEFVDVVN